MKYKAIYIDSCRNTFWEVRMDRLRGTRYAPAATLALCYMAAIVEGFDLQSAGVTAPRFGPAYGLSASQMAAVFSFNTFGLFLGAIFGGWIADRLGRKTVLVASLLTFGVFSISTAYAPGASTLILMRFLTGLGLGGAMPNVISMVSETGRQETSSARVTALTAGMPLGGVSCSLIAYFGGDAIDWRLIFQVGGWAPVLLAPAIWLGMPESVAFHHMKRDRAEGRARSDERKRNIVLTLLGEGRAVLTMALWASCFFVLLIQSVLQNWLPVLLVGKGFGKPDATLGAMTYSAGNTVGGLALGWLVARGQRRALLAITYCGMGTALFALAEVDGAFPTTALVILAVGIFVGAALFLLYGLSAGVYPVAVRSTGVGFGVASGRLGAVAGPAVAGMVLSRPGAGPTDVFISILPAIAVAGIAVMILCWRPDVALDQGC